MELFYVFLIAFLFGILLGTIVGIMISLAILRMPTIQTDPFTD